MPYCSRMYPSFCSTGGHQSVVTAPLLEIEGGDEGLISMTDDYRERVREMIEKYKETLDRLSNEGP